MNPVREHQRIMDERDIIKMISLGTIPKPWSMHESSSFSKGDDVIHTKFMNGIPFKHFETKEWVIPVWKSSWSMFSDETQGIIGTIPLRADYDREFRRVTASNKDYDQVISPTRSAKFTGLFGGFPGEHSWGRDRGILRLKTFAKQHDGSVVVLKDNEDHKYFKEVYHLYLGHPSRKEDSLRGISIKREFKVVVIKNTQGSEPQFFYGSLGDACPDPEAREQQISSIVDNIKRRPSIFSSVPEVTFGMYSHVMEQLTAVRENDVNIIHSQARCLFTEMKRNGSSDEDALDAALTLVSMKHREGQ